MKDKWTSITEPFLQLLFPHLCCGCGSDALSRKHFLCLSCEASLPVTGFAGRASNTVEKKFWGRLPLQSASAEYFFSQGSIVQELVHELKYKGNRLLGAELGRRMGRSWLQSATELPELLIPLPLFPSREKKRGYNQAEILCSGIAEVLNIPVWTKAVRRAENTSSQTSKGRIERWRNMEGKFILESPSLISNRHVLLVDDVITTGATLEACGMEILKAEGARLSIAAMCFANH